MADGPAAPDARPVQIPVRIHAVGPGWRHLLGREQIRSAFPGYRLLDLKEKLGGLRVYVEGPPGSGDILGSLIAPADEEAERTCEFCGALGRIRTRDDWQGGWRKSVCDTCHSDWSARRIMIVCGVVRGRG
ncbi:hypothetical protein ACWDBD_41510 [Streptomyces sp. NPDC001118]|uniref:hypothetical protein n=1 Tax=unclassified Streptomyces TaxID=2593676 RepID=UPI00131DE424|nr:MULTISPECIES: hypothetical protein [unclassified Streptomyces]MDX3231820.1 hypothetical protein [Streptomyces sp. ME19-01-6]